MATYVNLGCIRCEDRGCVVKTKSGYRCEGCGFVWQLDKAKKPPVKTATKKA